MMGSAMPRPVAYITARPAPIEVQIKHLGIPKARQKRLLAIMDQAWARVAKEKEGPLAGSDEVNEKSTNASAAD